MKGKLRVVGLNELLDAASKEHTSLLICRFTSGLNETAPAHVC